MKIRNLLAVAGIAALAACGGGGDDSSSTTTTSNTTTNRTVPTDLALSSPTASASSSSDISVGKAAAGDATGSTCSEKKAALQKLINGTEECSFTLQIPTITDTTCYGPSLTYSGHPDATGGQNPNGTLPHGDVGIWNATNGSSSEACAAAKMNELVGKVSSRVDNMISLFGVAACVGKKAGITLPDVGASVDLSSAFTTYASVTGLTVNSAKLERLANDSAGNTVWQYTLSVTMTFAQLGKTKTGTIILKHIPTATDNSTYKGKLSVAMTHDSELGGNCKDISGAASGSTTGSVILYEKTDSTHVAYKLNDAEFCGSNATVLNSNNDIDFADKASPSNKDGWANNAHFGIFNLNPEACNGAVAFAWQAGNGDQRTRVLNIAVSTDTGTAYFGFGPDIASSSGVGSINGIVCNWAGPNGAIQQMDRTNVGLTKVQNQALTKSGGIFVPSTNKITYAPTNSGNSSGGSFLFYNSSPTTTMTNDVRTAASVTNNLVNLSDMVFTAPTAPAGL